MTDDQKQKAACDRALQKAAKTMIGSIGASPEMMIDRILTFAGAQMVHLTSQEEAAWAFRKCAEAVETGMFNKFDRTTSGPGN